MRLRYFIILLAFFSACGIQEVEDSISLNGEWKFFASNNLTENEILSGNLEWDTIIVPGNWDTKEKYAEYSGKGYYQRNFTVPKNWKGNQIRIKFNAVYQSSKVWLNGILLGNHVGGYTPFEFNITELVKYGKSNTILVMADNSYKRGAWWAWGGISRDVTLLRNRNVRFVHQHITAMPDFETNEVHFIIDYKIENNSNSETSLTISSEIGDISNESILSNKMDLTINQQEVRSAQISFVADLSKFKLWNLDSPNLYQVKSTISEEEELDNVVDKFGIRKIEVKGEQLFLNNKVLYANGLNRVHDHPEFGNTEPDHLIRADILDIKSLGCNFARLMHAPLAPNLLNFCDSIGFLVIEEIPVWGNDDPNSFPNNPQTKQWIKAMVDRDYNHACVVGWSVGNELRDSVPPWGKKILTPQQLDYVNSMLDYVEKLDTTRLKIYVSLSAGSIGADKTNEPYNKIDMICLNSYGHAVETVQRAHKNFPGKPIFLSEIGRNQIGPAPDAKLQEDLIGFMNELKTFDYVVGISYWCYNDYRSNYKGTPESGFREWGIVDEQRNKKAAYNQLKEIYQNWHKE